MKIYTIWPATKDGDPATSAHAWRQTRRWFVLDVTDGLDAARVVFGPTNRAAACAEEMRLRAAQHQENTDA